MYDPTITTDIINQFCEKYNIPCQENAADSFCVLTKELLEFNEHTNLTAIRDVREVAIKHHADSLFGLTTGLIAPSAKVIDIGCGAGFPGLPLKIMRPDIDISFLDSTEKKLRFTSAVSEKLGFSSTILPVRAEDAAKDKAHREKYDIAVSRAMANLPVLVELALPFVKTGGYFIAYKRAEACDISNPESELSKAKLAISQLGGQLVESKMYDLDLFYSDSSEERRHCLIIIHKKKSSPDTFPRRYAQILKKPLIG